MSSANPAHAQPNAPVKTALDRLAELQRSLQRQLNRRPTVAERAAMDRLALLMLRSEIAARDIKATSADVVRLDNACRRARLDFERLIHVGDKPKRQRTMADIEAELRAHG